jgi:protein gp37
MSENTKIEWCDHTWNPWRGCTKVSPGCANCYAERQSKRNSKVLGQWGPGAPRVLAKNWGDPLKWNRKFAPIEMVNAIGERFTVSVRKPTVFPSFCDWLDDEVDVKWLERFLELIHKTQHLNWLLLTKRPENFVNRLREVQRHMTVDPLDIVDRIDAWISGYRVPQNVWIGTSVEDQQRANERIPELLDIPAKLRFLSVEPLLGPVYLRLPSRSFGFPSHITKEGHAVGMPQGLHWVIVGGESGPKSRSCNVEWIRSIVNQCKVSGVPCFVKQLGSRVIDPFTTCAHTVQFNQCWPDGTETNGHHVLLTHPKGGAPSEWPEDLRVRQFPEVKP